MKDIKQFPVGSVCIVVDAFHMKWMIGKEVTITGPLQPRYNDEENRHWMGYTVDVKDENFTYCQEHAYLKLKEPPKSSAEDEAFRSFMDRVMSPVKITEEV